MADICTDNRFELIEKYKKELIESTNITTSQDEMVVLDNLLFRFWQMGWLDKLEQQEWNNHTVACLMADTVDRQAVIKAVHETMYGFFNIVDDDSEEPITKEDERLLVINKAITKRIKSLPSAQPERKRGKWEIIMAADGFGEPYPCGCSCSECGFQNVVEDNYCPNCGSYNGGGDDEQIN